MDSDDWLDRFQTSDSFRRLLHSQQAAAGEVEQKRKRLLASVAGVFEMLDGKRDRRDLGRMPGLYGFREDLAVSLAPSELRRVEELSARLWTEMGTGRTYVEEALLGQIAVAADAASLPFFQAALKASRPRDVFQPQRRRMAVAAIAHLAAHTGSLDAHGELVRLLSHEDPAVRGDAVEHYARIHRTAKGKLPTEVSKRFLEIAREDQVFIPRFLARLYLDRAGHSVPVEPPNGVYAFVVSLGSISRTIELTADQSLDVLAAAILGAFNWDSDHLYEFAMTGEVRARRLVLPTEADRGEFRNAGPPTADIPVGALGLTRGHRFLFRYDFGDDHRFRVDVAAIHPSRERRTRYPRVVARSGKSPEQYPVWA